MTSLNREWSTTFYMTQSLGRREANIRVPQARKPTATTMMRMTMTLKSTSMMRMVKFPLHLISRSRTPVSIRNLYVATTPKLE